MALHRYSVVLGTVVFVGLSGCTSVPPQIAQVHLKEKEIIESLRVSHLAIADAYMEKRLEQFEDFYFKEYGKIFYKNWMEAFQKQKERKYDPEKDFPAFYQDLVAEYQIRSASIVEMRSQLRKDITIEYRNALGAHSSVGEWLDVLNKLNEAQRQGIDSVLGSIRPGLSLDSIDDKIERIKKDIIS